MQIDHFYHVYADGKWQEPLDEHCTALKDHGLYENLRGFYLGIVGTDDNAAAVIDRVNNHHGLSADVKVQQPIGWEQVTMEALKHHCITNDGCVFYAHTKSSYNYNEFNSAWRTSMCYWNVVRWREAYEALETHDIAGAHWLNNEMFGGTYWWARNTHIRKLRPLGYGSRFEAELWIGQRAAELEPLKVKDLNPGWPDWGVFTTSW